jgi:hypothetical protein
MRAPGRARTLVGFAAFGLFWGAWGGALPAVRAHTGVDDGALGVAAGAAVAAAGSLAAALAAVAGLALVLAVLAGRAGRPRAATSAATPS